MFLIATMKLLQDDTVVLNSLSSLSLKKWNTLESSDLIMLLHFLEGISQSEAYCIIVILTNDVAHLF